MDYEVFFVGFDKNIFLVICSAKLGSDVDDFSVRDMFFLRRQNNLMQSSEREAGKTDSVSASPPVLMNGLFWATQSTIFIPQCR